MMEIATEELWKLINGGTVDGWEMLEWKVVSAAGERSYRVVLCPKEQCDDTWGAFWTPGADATVRLWPMTAVMVTEYRFRDV